MPKLCFLFNHDQTHQLAHSLPIALAMIEQGHADVTLAVTSVMLEQEVKRLAGARIAPHHLVRLDSKGWISGKFGGVLDHLVPARKLLIYRDHLDFFRSFDALVVSEKSSLLLKSRYGLSSLKFIHTRHGAGDRAIGFNPESAKFDLVLVSGPKIRDRLIADAGLSPDKIRVTGYAKFDLFAGNEPAPLFPGPARKTVLYNPHPSPHLSSWYKMGEDIIRQFAAQDRYNFIFAPHVMLFERPLTVTIDRLRVKRAQKPDHALFDAAHMHGDLGSPKSSDMSYAVAADLYLGDVSSQVYEFLHRPRPCLFLNAHATDWQGDPNYKHWNAGPVIDSCDDILGAVGCAFEEHSRYLPVQEQMLSETFSVTDQPASMRAANAIAEFLDAAR